MAPLDLTKNAPRYSREELDGLVFLPRTIDKARATLPGGNLGDYRLPGFSTQMLEQIGVKSDEFIAAVAAAASDADVVAWLRMHADTAQYARWNAYVLARSVGDLAPDVRTGFLSRYPFAATMPLSARLVDIQEQDDRACFPPGA